MSIDLSYHKQQCQIRNQQLQKLSQDIESKINQLDDQITNKSEEEIVSIRTNQLALIKNLVFLYGGDQYLLVEAHAQLGEAYLNYGCFEQTINHLMISLKKNNQYFNENQIAQTQHIHILTLLGRCYLESEHYDDAQEQFDQALEQTKTLYSENDQNCAKIMILMSKCHTKKGEYDTALENLFKIWEILEQQDGIRSEPCAQICVEISDIYQKKEDIQEAITYLERAIHIYEQLNYNDLEFVANLHQKISVLYEKTGEIELYLKYLYKVRDIFQQIYGINNKGTIKTKRMIALALLKMSDKNSQALQELLEVEDLEYELYGEDSIQVAKTQKIIGTLYLVTNSYSEASKYLLKAQKIFEENGNKKIVQEIKHKIKIIQEMKDKNIILQT